MMREVFVNITIIISYLLPGTLTWETFYFPEIAAVKYGLEWIVHTFWTSISHSKKEFEIIRNDLEMLGLLKIRHAKHVE
jgi:hypothetical protein